MIARLEGTILALEEGLAIVDVGGVGFAVHVPANADLHAGQVATLFTYLHVRENELTLYGFPDAEQKSLFKLLLGVSGVGPKAALSVLSTLSPETLRRAILNKQPAVLARAPGVGKKTGEAIVLHLKDKIKQRDGIGLAMTEDDTDVIAALTALGFSVVEAQRALQQLPRGQPLSLDEKIRRALIMLGQ